MVYSVDAYEMRLMAGVLGPWSPLTIWGMLDMKNHAGS